MASVAPELRRPIATSLPETKLGRPSIYTDEIADEICRRLSEGEPLARIVRDKHMPSFTTVMDWEATNAGFARRSAPARAYGTHYMADDCIRIADDTEIDPAHKRIMVETRIRLIGKWNAAAYGERKILAGDPDAPLIPRTIDPRRLDPDQRELLKQLLLAASAPEVDGEFTEADSD